MAPQHGQMPLRNAGDVLLSLSHGASPLSTPRVPPSPAEPQGRLMPALGTGHPIGTYATEHWAKARYSSSTSSPLFSSLRNSWTQLEGAEG